MPNFVYPSLSWRHRLEAPDVPGNYTCITELLSSSPIVFPHFSFHVLVTHHFGLSFLLALLVLFFILGRPSSPTRVPGLEGAAHP